MEFILEEERDWLWTERPGTNFWFTVNKPQAQGLTSLIKKKLKPRSARAKKVGLFHLKWRERKVPKETRVETGRTLT